MPDPKSAEDLPFHHYTLKHRVTAWVSLNLFDNITYTVRHGILKGMRRKGGLGWLPTRLAPGVITAEQQFWSRLDFSGMTVYDIGAFHGILTLLFATRARQVVCFEPSSRNRKRLTENLQLNGIRNVEVRASGVGSRRETLTLVATVLMPGFATVNRQTAEDLSRSGLKSVAEEISIVTLDEEIPEAHLPPPDFIKIDIEGWELEALRGARKTIEDYRPVLFLEMHGETVREKKRKVADIVAFLWEIGYRQISHVESGAVITPENSEAAMQGHLYCRPA